MAGYDPNAELMSDRRAFRAEMTAARLEIMRLQAGLSEAKFERDNNRAKLELAKCQRDAAWNDAIEAAAEVAKGYTKGALSLQAVDVIRALKRT